MLPSLGFQEILLLAVIALVVVGPKDLPLMLRKLGRWTAKLRGMAQEFRSGFDELARQAELDELKKEVEALRQHQTFSELDREIRRPAILPGTLPPPPVLETPALTPVEEPLEAESVVEDAAAKKNVGGAS
ncbi:MAG: Sec-independent protein translocase protein TatB [Hyphomonadaceae bacterium]